MFNRIISLILIAAVFGCPLWCSMGICECTGGANAAMINVKLDQCCQPPCCTNVTETTRESRSSSTDDPQPKPEGLRCQGICGGAVLESPCQIPAVELCQFSPVLNNVQYRLLATQLCEFREPDSPDYNRSENRGRSVRIRHMSFQC
jgi:hypothetical protein